MSPFLFVGLRMQKNNGMSAEIICFLLSPIAIVQLLDVFVVTGCNPCRSCLHLAQTLHRSKTKAFVGLRLEMQTVNHMEQIRVWGFSYLPPVIFCLCNHAFWSWYFMVFYQVLHQCVHTSCFSRDFRCVPLISRSDQKDRCIDHVDYYIVHAYIPAYVSDWRLLARYTWCWY